MGSFRKGKSRGGFVPSGGLFPKKDNRKAFLGLVAAGAGVIALAALGLAASGKHSGGSLTAPKIPYWDGSELADSGAKYVVADPSISPTSNNAVDLGDPSFEWRNIYSLGQANLDHVFIQPATTLVQPLIVRPAAGSGENIVEVDDATNTNVWLFINSSGQVNIAKLNVTSVFSLAPGVSVPSPPFVVTTPSGSANLIEPVNSSTPALQIQDAGPASGNVFIDIIASNGSVVWKWVTGTMSLIGGSFDSFGTGAALTLQRSATTSLALVTENQSDLVPRFGLFQSGQMAWGTGVNTAQDTELERAAAGVLKINLTSALIAPPANTRAALALEGNETSHVERRLRNSAGIVTITNSANTTIMQISPLSAVTPTRINASGEAVGTSLLLPHADHTHQLAPLITGEDIQWQNGSLTPGVPGNEYFDANSGTITYGNGAYSAQTAGSFINGSILSGNFAIDVVPQGPAIIWHGPSANFAALGLADLVLVSLDDGPVGNAFFHMVSYDASGAFTGTVNGMLFGDDGTLGGTTTNVLFKCGSGSTFDIHQFTGGLIMPVKGINEAAPGGAATTKAITFAVAQSNATYGIEVTPQGNCEIWVTNKLTTGFTLNYSVAGGVACDWELYR